MFSSQQVVIKWVEYAAAGAILILIAKFAVSRLRQPADRINLILISFVAAAGIPLLVCLPNVPVWHLGVIAPPQSEFVAPTVASSQPPVFTESGPDLIEDDFELRRDMVEAPAADSPFETPVEPPAETSTREVLSPAAPVATEIPVRRVDPWSVAAAVLLLVNSGATTVLFAEWLLGMRYLRAISSRSLPASQAVRSLWLSITQGRGESIRTLVSSEISTPLAYGCLRTTVMIPRSMTEGKVSTLRFCLAHEWSHIVRRDLPAWRLTWLCQFVLWFQPLFWIMRRELRVCQDFLADHQSANEGADALEYSELLMAFTRQQTGRPIAGAIAFFDRSSQLSRRINMLLNSHVVLRSRSSLRFRVAAIAMTLMCSGVISLVRLDSVQAGDTPPLATAPKAEEPKSGEQLIESKTDKPETLRYAAAVVDKETGKGIANATIVVRRCKRGSQEYAIIQETRHKTDAEGKYSFEIPPEQVAIDNLYIELDVEHDDYTARKGFGYALGMIRKNEQLGERPFFEKIELWPSDPITGTVLSPNGKPIAGVKVLGYSKRSPDVAGDYGLLTDSVTDQAGKFRLSLVKGGMGIFWVVPVDFASTSRDVNKKRGDVGEIRLRPGVRATGRILSAEGKPVADIPVNIQYLKGGSEAVNKIQLSTLICRSALTDQDGNFTFDPLPNGEYQLLPETYRNDPLKTHFKRYEIPGVFFPTKVQIEEGYVFPPIEIQASPHVTFNAQIYDSKGAKIGGHLVMLSGRMDGEDWFGQARPSSEGTIAFRMPRGLRDVKVELNTNEHGALRYRRGKGQDLESNQLQIELGTLDEDVEGFEIIRYQAPLVLVNAIDAEQKQVKGFRVSANYPWSKQPSFVREGGMRSDLNFGRQDDGRYRTQKMLPDEDVKFTVAADGYETVTETVRLSEGETKDLVVTLKKLLKDGQINLGQYDAIQVGNTHPPAAAVKAEDANTKKLQTKETNEPKADEPETLRYTAVVLDKKTGKGIPNATVVVRRASEVNTIIQETQHKTDAEGKYSFEIPPEQVSVPSLHIELDVEHDDYAAKKGFGYALSMIRKNEKLGERPFFEKVELRQSEPITGTVLAPDGKPLAGVKVQGYSKASARDVRDYGSFTEAVTDNTGKFRLNLVKGGVGVYWVLPVDYASTSRDVNKERGDVGEIRLRPGVRVSGRVLSHEGKPVASIPVNIQYQEGGSETVNSLVMPPGTCRSALTDKHGHFAFDPLPDGDYRVIPETYRRDSITRDHKRYEISGVFLPTKVKIQEGIASAPIEIQASPHIIFNAQSYDSKGAKRRGHEVMFFGQLDGERWFGEGHPNSEGTIALRVPHGLQQVQVQFLSSEHDAIRFRRGKGKDLENNQMRIKLGTLNEDVEGFEVILYKAPIVLVNAVDTEQKQVKGFRVSATYPLGKPAHVEPRSDLYLRPQKDGRYRTHQMLPDEAVKFTVTADGYEAATETVMLGEGQTKDLVVTLKKAVESKL